MLMYAEHRKSGGQKVSCPLCRTDWGPLALQDLQEPQRSEVKRCRRKMDSILPVQCNSCKVNLLTTFFRCLVCTPAGSADLCRRCYGSSGRSHCESTTGGHERLHLFVQGEVSGPTAPNWKPALCPEATSRGRNYGGSG
ncbi:unnamed protein product, partial [Choristocarpus tenellus]